MPTTIEEILQMGQIPPAQQPASVAPNVPQLVPQGPALQAQRNTISVPQLNLAHQASPIHGGGIIGHLKNRFRARNAERLAPIFRNQVLEQQALGQGLQNQLRAATLRLDVEKAQFQTEKSAFDAQKSMFESAIKQLEAQNTPQALRLANELQEAKINKEQQLALKEKEITRKVKLQADMVVPESRALINARNASATASLASAGASNARRQNTILARSGIAARNQLSQQKAGQSALDRQIKAAEQSIANLESRGQNLGLFNASGVPFDVESGAPAQIPFIGGDIPFTGDATQAAQFQQQQQLQQELEQGRAQLENLLRLKLGASPNTGTVLSAPQQQAPAIGGNAKDRFLQSARQR